MKKIIYPIVILSIIVGIIFYFNIFNLIQNKESNDSQYNKILIGYPQLRIALPVIVAKEKGFFKEEGLDIELKSYQTAQPMMDALVSGKINIGGFCALPITFGAIARSKTDLLFLGGMYENDAFPISVLLTKTDSNIKSVKDLEGKKIGILPTRAYEVWLQGILEGSNVDLDKVIIRQIKPNFQADALKDGSIDALFTNDPVSTVIVSKGIGQRLSRIALVPSTTERNPFYFGSFNIRKDYGDKNPEIVLKIAKALDKANDYIKNNQKEAKLIMADEKGNYLPKAFRPIVGKFPDSFFKKANKVSDTDLLRIKDFYLEKKVLPVDINTKGLQFNY